MPQPTSALLVDRVLDWYAGHARDLPWRTPGIGAWPIMVSEFMLQQTPVSRVLDPWRQWVDRWPTPAALSAVPSGDAVRAWGRLGYPRRGLRLHQAATVITDRFDGEVPSDYDALLSLPGVGPYTAAAVASFAFGARHVVLDTNVRRVLARSIVGVAQPSTTPTAAERVLGTSLLPEAPARAARWAVASMELGAVVCGARSPHCPNCPIADLCAWNRAGRPAYDGPPRVGQAYDGTDRQCRGALLAVLRSTDGRVLGSQLTAAWPEGVQRTRALASLVADGLVVAVGEGYALPG
ncbi:MAG: A/G-specific adenine glycosylase [Propionibacteriaceae bacterium]